MAPITSIQEKMTCEEMWERGEGVFPDADKEARI